MGLKVHFVILLLSILAAAESTNTDIESRGKKKKIALFIYFADLVLKKIFVLKLIYAFVFWVVIHKAGYFLSWFATYLKEQKQHYDHHDHYVPQHQHEYGPPVGPYRRRNQN